MNEENLNPDALEVLATVVFSCSIEDWNEHDEDEKRQLLAPYTRVIHAYLSALPAQLSEQQVRAEAKAEALRDAADALEDASVSPIWCWDKCGDANCRDDIRVGAATEIQEWLRQRAKGAL